MPCFAWGNHNRLMKEKLKRKDYNKELERLHGELVRLQQWVVHGVEQAIVDSGVILLKYWLEVSAEEQTRRLEARIDDPRKIWKLSPMDLKSYSRWHDYSRARDDMFEMTDTKFAPWYVARSE